MRADHRNAANALVSSAAKQAAATGLPRSQNGAVSAAPPLTELPVSVEPEVLEQTPTDEAATPSAPEATTLRSRRPAKAPTAFGFAVPKSALDTDQTVQLGLRIPKRLHAALKAAAYMQDVSLQDLATQAITEKLLALSGGQEA